MAVDQPKPADAVRPADDGPSGVASETATPGTPAKPGASATPGTPAKPGASAKPGTPAKPGASAKPGARAKPGAEAKSDLDDMKRKFREALDRKHGSHSAANAEGAQDTGKVHGAHGPAASRRSFRRKSGG